MLQPLFHIESDNIETQDFQSCRLLIVVDDYSLSYVMLNITSNQPYCIKYFHFNQIQNREQNEILREIIYGDELLSKEVNEIFLVYGFPESTLVPEACFDENIEKEFTDLMHGNLEKGFVVNEKVPWWDIHNVYRLPSDIRKLLQYKFNSAKHIHYYSLLLKSQKKYSAAELPENILAIFLEERMIVSIYKKNQLQLMQSFEFVNQTDVAYFLLNCCNQLGLHQNSLSLQVSGFIEKESAIYNELAKYFSDISFEEIGDGIVATDKLEQYPLHYFSTLLKLAACV
jgi:hypothetical protein